MSSEPLVVLLSGEAVGVVSRDRSGRLELTYDEAWRSAPGALPLSLSMPLVGTRYGPPVVDAFLWNLLPDNDRVLDRWAREFHVSARSPFALLAHVGEDCAGAVQLVRADRVKDLAAGGPGTVTWLDEAGVAERLRLLRENGAAWRKTGDAGRFSLSGAQPKTALLFERGRWGVPSGRTPTTHILKPPTGELAGHVENEHLCLALAREVGFPTATTEVRRFGDELAIVVERYDRLRVVDRPDRRPGRAPARPHVLRLHQEDLCQALGVPPTRKYQSQGGPSPEAVVDLLRTHSTRPVEDVTTFVDALALNWLIVGTDAHAKNYSLLLGAGGTVRLAPLYDVASALPYDDLDPEKLKLAMKVGGTYRLRDIGANEWRRLARAIRLPPDELVARIAELAARVAGAVPVVVERARSGGLQSAVIARLADRLVRRARRCRDDLGT